MGLRLCISNTLLGDAEAAGLLKGVKPLKEILMEARGGKRAAETGWAGAHSYLRLRLAKTAETVSDP